MCYYQKQEWTIVPKSSPVVNRHCPKCGIKTDFINSKRFRVNANGKNLDIWLIFNCSKCKSKWNLSIHERINPKKIDREVYSEFMNNDLKLANLFGADTAIHRKNNSELVYESSDYEVHRKTIQENPSCNAYREIKILCPEFISLRLDKFLADQLRISRSKLSEILSKDMALNKKIKSGLTIVLPAEYL